MTIERAKVRPTEHYRGSDVDVVFLGPDLLCQVNGQQIGGYWLNAEAASANGRRYIDQVEDEKARKARGAAA